MLFWKSENKEKKPQNKQTKNADKHCVFFVDIGNYFKMQKEQKRTKKNFVKFKNNYNIAPKISY